MTQKRIFKKYYHRSMWLLDAEIWYHGERFRLADITDDNAEYITMFVYDKGKGTGVYYDITGPEDADEGGGERCERPRGPAAAAHPRPSGRRPVG